MEEDEAHAWSSAIFRVVAYMSIAVKEPHQRAPSKAFLTVHERVRQYKLKRSSIVHVPS